MVKNPKLRFLIVTTGLVFLLTFVLVACGGTPGKPFGHTVPEYSNTNPARAQDLTKPYITGKIVAVDVADKTYSDLNNQLGDLKAKDTSEVGTIVWVTCCKMSIDVNSEQIQNYTVTVTIIDAGKNQVVGEKDFTYPQAGGQAVGGTADPYKVYEPDAVSWIESLPRK